MPVRASRYHNNGRLRRRHLARRLEILRAAGNEFRVRGFCQDVALDRLLAALEQARRLRSTAAARLHLVIVSHVRCVLDEIEGAAAHLLTNALPPQMQRSLMAKRDRYEDGVRQLIANGMRSGEFVPRDAALATRAMLGALNWSVRWFKPDGTLTATEIAGEFAEYLIRGLLAKPEAARRRLASAEAGKAGRDFSGRVQGKDKTNSSGAKARL